MLLCENNFKGTFPPNIRNPPREILNTQSASPIMPLDAPASFITIVVTVDVFVVVSVIFALLKCGSHFRLFFAQGHCGARPAVTFPATEHCRCPLAGTYFPSHRYLCTNCARRRLT